MNIRVMKGDQPQGPIEYEYEYLSWEWEIIGTELSCKLSTLGHNRIWIWILMYVWGRATHGLVEYEYEYMAPRIIQFIYVTCMVTISLSDD